MTFLSIASPHTPTTAWSAAETYAGLPRVARLASMLIVLAGLTVPSAVAHAKWVKVGLVAAFAQHRMLGNLSI